MSLLVSLLPSSLREVSIPGRIVHPLAWTRVDMHLLPGAQSALQSDAGTHKEVVGGGAGGFGSQEAKESQEVDQ